MNSYTYPVSLVPAITITGVTQSYVDSSLAKRDSSINFIINNCIKNSSIGNNFSWNTSTGLLQLNIQNGLFQWDGTPYSSQTAGKFDNSVATPQHNNLLNYDGFLNATRIAAYGPSGYSAGYFVNANGAEGIIASGTTKGISAQSYSGVAGEFITTGGNCVYGNSAAGTVFQAYSSAGGFLYEGDVVGVGTGANLLLLRRLSTSGNATGDIISLLDNPTTAGTISGSLIKATIGSTVRFDMNPRVVDSSTAVGFTFDTHNLLSTIGSKLANWKNSGTEKVYFDKDGNVVSNGYFLTPYTTTYTTAIPFDKLHTDMDTHTMVGNVAFTINSSNSLDSSETDLLLINNASYSIDVSQFHSAGIYDNTLAYSLLSFIRKRGLYIVSILNFD
jgi:hypothetical protein